MAIATALMPPLCVVGFGLAVGNWSIASGAGLLFLTNLVAIALAAAGVATWFGFAQARVRHTLARQGIIGLLVLAPLTVPLVTTLRDIAAQAWITNQLRGATLVLLERHPGIELKQFRVDFADSARPHAYAVVFAQQRAGSLQAEAHAAWTAALERPVEGRVDQVLVSSADDLRTSALANPVGKQPDPEAQPATQMATALRQNVPMPLEAVDVDPAANRVTLLALSDPRFDLSALKAMEDELQQRYPTWKLALIPPLQPLPPVRFQRGESDLRASSEQRLAVIAWALQRWHLEDVEVVGYASSDGRGTTPLARARAEAVAEWLRQRQITAQASSVYPMPQQRQVEAEHGFDAMRKAEVMPRWTGVRTTP